MCIINDRHFTSFKGSSFQKIYFTYNWKQSMMSYKGSRLLQTRYFTSHMRISCCLPLAYFLLYFLFQMFEFILKQWKNISFFLLSIFCVDILTFFDINPLNGWVKLFKEQVASKKCLFGNIRIFVCDLIFSCKQKSH